MVSNYQSVCIYEMLRKFTNYRRYLFTICSISMSPSAIEIGFISRRQFTDAYGLYFDGTSQIEDIFNKCDVDGSDSLDYVEWIDGLDFQGLRTLAVHTNAHTDNPFLEVKPNHFFDADALLAILRSSPQYLICHGAKSILTSVRNL